MSLEDADRLTREALRRLRDAEGILKDAILSTDNPRQRGYLTGKLHAIQRRLSTAFPWYSQAGQDRWLDETVFKSRRDGVFLDIGAYDGLTGSNSFFFEAVRGWSGLLVEASPQLAALARTRRSQPVASCAVGADDGQAGFLVVEQGFTQMGGLIETLDPDTLARIRSHPRHLESNVDITLRSAASLVAEYDLGRIDLVFIDVEGAETDVLKGFPFDQVRPMAFCIENNFRDDRLVTLMAKAGYLRAAFIGADEIYLHRDESVREGLVTLQ